jgi:hypothetical protein
VMIKAKRARGSKKKKGVYEMFTEPSDKAKWQSADDEAWHSVSQGYDGWWDHVEAPSVVTHRGCDCKFPFSYHGIEHSTCIWDDHNTPWCEVEGQNCGIGFYKDAVEDAGPEEDDQRGKGGSDDEIGEQDSQENASEGSGGDEIGSDKERGALPAKGGEGGSRSGKGKKGSRGGAAGEKGKRGGVRGNKGQGSGVWGDQGRGSQRSGGTGGRGFSSRNGSRGRKGSGKGNAPRIAPGRQPDRVDSNTVLGGWLLAPTTQLADTAGVKRHRWDECVAPPPQTEVGPGPGPPGEPLENVFPQPVSRVCGDAVGRWCATPPVAR